MHNSALVGALTATVLVGGSLYAVARDEPVTVTRIVDGDTIDVLRDGSEVRVRLLNVDTPESVDPDSTVECLGPEATAHLEALLPIGTAVRLEHDVELTDRYDRELAGVYVDDTLVNAEIARAGLGVPVLYEPNARFYDEVAAAWGEATDAARGLVDPAIGCTLDHEVTALEQSVSDAVTTAPEDTADLSDLEGHETLLAAELVAAEALAVRLAEPSGVLAMGDLGPRTVARLHGRVSEVESTLQDALQTAQRRVTDEVERLAAEEEAARRAAEEEAARQAAEEEAARRAAEEEAARQAAEEEAARQAAEEEAARRAAEEEAAERRQQERSGPAGGTGTPAPAPAPAPAPPPAPAPEPAPEPLPPSARPGAGYTGCRAYVGGPYLDDQGRSYTPIDCTTRQPLVP